MVHHKDWVLDTLAKEGGYDYIKDTGILYVRKPDLKWWLMDCHMEYLRTRFNNSKLIVKVG